MIPVWGLRFRVQGLGVWLGLWFGGGFRAENLRIQIAASR